MTDRKHAAEWFKERAKNTPMRGARAMFEMAADALSEQANGVTVGDANNATTTWRPASEPPKEEDSYLVYSCKSKTVFTARYRPRCKRWANRANGQFITHWMPLPQPPKEVE